MLKRSITLINLVLLCSINLHAQKAADKNIEINYVDEFKNSNHPQIGYWFFSGNMLVKDRYIQFLDSIAANTKFDFIFLTAREDVNFYEYNKYEPVLKKLVGYAHSLNIKIGLQLWQSRAQPAQELTDRFISEGEIVLDENGKGEFGGIQKGIRDTTWILKSGLFKVWVFKKTGDGFYDKASVKDVTNLCTSQSPKKDSVFVTINLGSQYKNYTAFIMLQHYSKSISHYTNEASNRLVDAMKAYRHIPFNGIALDEFSIVHILQSGTLEKMKSVFRERIYSLPMAKKYKEQTGVDLEQALFNMRYAPSGKPEITSTAINNYMEIIRKSSVHIEKIMYEKAKEFYGNKTFIGCHNTFHNSLINDEIWATGCTWWSIKRDYGHTDELTPTPTQMGIAMAYPQNVLYNMYYTKNIDNFTNKALTDLRYGIRTHYHAFNDRKPWGISLENPEAYKNITPVENAARLLNQFNPALPQIKLLVVFGMEALSNWYPDKNNRGMYDINDKLKIEEKAVAIWEAGYTNALVPTDLIMEKKLTIGADGKPTLNGHKFDAVIFLYPQYAQEPVLQFLESYVKQGGRLMLEGNATVGFNGNDITNRFKSIADKAIVKQFSIEEISKLGITKNRLPDGCKSADGSYVFTDIQSLKNNTGAFFLVKINGDTYSGIYSGLLAIDADKNGIKKMAATALRQLSKNGTIVFELDKMADVFINANGKKITVTIADKEKQIKILVNKL
jgi:hypothetical protein